MIEISFVVFSFPELPSYRIEFRLSNLRNRCHHHIEILWKYNDPIPDIECDFLNLHISYYAALHFLHILVHLPLLRSLFPHHI